VGLWRSLEGDLQRLRWRFARRVVLDHDDGHGHGALESGWLVSVYSPAGTLLGSQTVTVNSDGPSVFFGVISTGTDQIGQIQLLGNTTNGATERFAGLDSLAFPCQPRAAGPPAVAQPPPAEQELSGIRITAQRNASPGLTVSRSVEPRQSFPTQAAWSSRLSGRPACSWAERVGGRDLVGPFEDDINPVVNQGAS
jgi:hypothetical protein